MVVVGGGGGGGGGGCGGERTKFSVQLWSQAEQFCKMTFLTSCDGDEHCTLITIGKLFSASVFV